MVFRSFIRRMTNYKCTKNGEYVLKVLSRLAGVLPVLTWSNHLLAHKLLHGFSTEKNPSYCSKYVYTAVSHP